MHRGIQSLDRLHFEVSPVFLSSLMPLRSEIASLRLCLHNFAVRSLFIAGPICSCLMNPGLQSQMCKSPHRFTRFIIATDRPGGFRIRPGDLPQSATNLYKCRTSLYMGYIRVLGEVGCMRTNAMLHLTRSSQISKCSFRGFEMLASLG